MFKYVEGKPMSLHCWRLIIWCNCHEIAILHEIWTFSLPASSIRNPQMSELQCLQSIISGLYDLFTMAACPHSMYVHIIYERELKEVSVRSHSLVVYHALNVFPSKLSVDLFICSKPHHLVQNSRVEYCWHLTPCQIVCLYGSKAWWTWPQWGESWPCSPGSHLECPSSPVAQPTFRTKIEN